jgi:hypothetical protein
MPPLLVRIIRYALIGTGAVTLASTVVNIIGAVRLIDPSDETALGLTRTEIIGWYAGSGLVGLIMIAAGLFWRRKR